MEEEIKEIISKKGYNYEPLLASSVKRVHALFLQGEIYSPEVLEEYKYLGIYYHDWLEDRDLAISVFRAGMTLGCVHCQTYYWCCWQEIEIDPSQLVGSANQACASNACFIYRVLNRIVDNSTKSKTYQRLVEIEQAMTHQPQCLWKEGSDMAAISLSYFYREKKYSMVISICHQLLEKNYDVEYAHNYLSYYYYKVEFNESLMLYHARLSMNLSKNHLHEWYSTHLSLESLEFSLICGYPKLRDRCLKELPLSSKYVHLLLSIPTAQLKDQPRFLKRDYLQSCFEFYRYAPTYVSRYCVLDVQHLIRQLLE